MSPKPKYAVFYGIGLSILSAASIAIGPSLAKFAYGQGTDLITVMVIRGFVMIGICVLILLLKRRLAAPSSKVIILCVASGISFAAMSYGYFGAVQTIPVGIAVTLYFLHPILVMFAAHFIGLNRVTGRQIFFSIIVFIGLGIAVGIDIQGFDAQGILLSLLAAVAVTAMILLNAKALPKSDAITVNLIMVVTTTVIFLIWNVGLGNELMFPSTTIGWTAVVSVGLSFTIGLLSFFYAVDIIGPVLATMITSLQPLFAILFASLLLSENLTLLQISGALLVITGLALRDKIPTKTKADIPFSTMKDN
ncbi:MAG: DMT family transporter [Rhizobiaceae bacterium]|nr:DMT family transporter [Rhizobiaceae bacterium]